MNEGVIVSVYQSICYNNRDFVCISCERVSVVQKSPYLLLVNGPNLNRLGKRDPLVYGTQTMEDVTIRVERVASEYGVAVHPFQSNHEGALIDFIQQEGPNSIGMVMNPGAYGHTSIALRDCVEDIRIPTMEVHISNVHKRESFRHQLVLASVVTGQIVGLGILGYELATQALCTLWMQQNSLLKVE